MDVFRPPLIPSSYYIRGNQANKGPRMVLGNNLYPICYLYFVLLLGIIIKKKGTYHENNSGYSPGEMGCLQAPNTQIKKILLQEGQA